MQARKLPVRSIRRWALFAAAVAILASCESPIPDNFHLKSANERKPTPDFALKDATGATVKLSDYKGKVVLLNFWATWCGPCKVEMPTLAKLQAAYEGKPVEVMAVSIDTPEDAGKATLFIAQNSPLKFYIDREMKLPFKLKAPGTPTTVIYGKDGMEVGRVAGDANWTSPEAKALIDKALAS